MQYQTDKFWLQQTSVVDLWYFGTDPDPDSGSTDPCLWPMDPDSAIFFLDLHDANKNFFFLLITFKSYIYIIFLR